MLVPTLIFGAALGTAYLRAKPKRQAKPDPFVAHIFRQALDGKMKPAEYRTLADWMKKWGYLEEARVLNARASYGELPQATRDQHQAIITKTLQSKDPALVRRIAENLYHQGAIANGVRLRKHAAALDAAIKIAPIEPPPPVTPEPIVTPDPANGVSAGTGGPTQEGEQQAAE